MPTHVNRNESLFSAAMRWAKAGGYIDFTSGSSHNPNSDAVKPSEGIARCLSDNIALESLCMSSDGNGSLPKFDAFGAFLKIGIAGFEGLLGETLDLITKENVPIETAICPVTINPARALGLAPQKGIIAAGADADLILFDENMAIDHVYARGQQMVKSGTPIRFSTFS